MQINLSILQKEKQTSFQIINPLNSSGKPQVANCRFLQL